MPEILYIILGVIALFILIILFKAIMFNEKIDKNL